MEIEKKLQELGYELPNPPVPAANYIGCVRVGNLLFVGGNIGYSYGTNGVHDTWEVAPEAGVKWFLNSTTFVYFRVEYEIWMLLRGSVEHEPSPSKRDRKKRRLSSAGPRQMRSGMRFSALFCPTSAFSGDSLTAASFWMSSSRRRLPERMVRS